MTISSGDVRAMLLGPGEELRTGTGVPVRVVEYIGGGSQGEVYGAEVGSSTTSRAVKWYHGVCATSEQRAALEALLAVGAPSDRFVWPEDVVVSDAREGFGYLMPLLPASFHPLADVLRRHVEPTFHALLTAAAALADSFWALHARGLCYRDISFGNVYLDPAGRILVGDNDNVGVDGSTGGVLGTPRFMAPEIVRGDAPPSAATDLHSLAVLLFYLLLLQHPLEGLRESSVALLDETAQRALYGDNPLFIFDPDDEGNRPDPTRHDNALAYWQLYPQELRDAFTRAFTAGLVDPARRVRETEWRDTLCLLDALRFRCPVCGVERFLPSAGADVPPERSPCWACATGTGPARLVCRATVVLALQDGAALTSRLLGLGGNEVVGRVVAHPERPGVLGLENVTTQGWTAQVGDAPPRMIEPGQRVRLGPDVTLQAAGARLTIVGGGAADAVGGG